MSTPVLRARPPSGDVDLPVRREVPESRLVDAAYFPGGRADALFLASTEGEVAAVLRAHEAVLVVGAQSSLTGGATPQGGALLSTERFDALAIDGAGRRAVCGAGVPLSRLRDEARPLGLFCGAAPTYDGATIGGMAGTNAAGAATFKHGTMRAAVRRLVVVLADGSVLDVARGAATAHPAGWFEIVRVDGTRVRVPVPRYRDPAVPKCSAGYAAADGMDLVDLFVGSEGTLGVVTEVEVALEPLPAASLACWLPLGDEARALAIVAALREAAHRAWRTGGAEGLDVPAIEWFDARCTALLREDGIDRERGVPLGEDVRAVLIFTVDASADEAEAVERLERLLGADAARLDVALPGERSKAERFAAMREAVPMAVNHRIRDARLRDPAVTKAAGDFVVPFERLADSLRLYRAEFARRGLDAAIWGHVSDGNVHPNALPRTGAEGAAAKEALLAMAAEVVRWGGSPLAEHGVGRNPTKQAMLRMLRGNDGIEEMRAVKRALDPAWKLAPGVLFPR